MVGGNRNQKLKFPLRTLGYEYKFIKLDEQGLVFQMKEKNTDIEKSLITNLNVNIQNASNDDFIIIKKLIQLYELDNRNMFPSQFLVAKKNIQLLGFGRIKKHKNCDELCSLGILRVNRNKGIARFLVETIINMATQPIYVVSVIPDFFHRLGFETVNVYPAEIAEKLNYCIEELVVREQYVVMKYNEKSQPVISRQSF